ncbi:Tyrosine--tRNA ligase [Candidatus Megaera venefica]|uniref:Tyrosine--tRNA ligase n=1 Tax=Candidatus Megaera venefica TaxID=2055910 RepID=A0ABU5NEB1_9RICK|nr:tyrosine--tRNA ligase [Candidatus Megaera venefica]MEA0971499.1 Tyrosine--tRNA ligase [Candidatus Megaera venefica]
MTFFEEFKKRGYFHQCTNELRLQQKEKDQKIVAYLGFDCTAQSLHVGNLMQVMILRLLQQYGHKPIVLIGGATTKIGDPTGKEEARKYLSDEEIASNIGGIKSSLSKFIKFGDGPSDAIMVNNSDWLEKVGYIQFLREMGRMFSVNRMLTMDSVKSRLEREQSLTFLEFNYMLLQAYDFYHLNKEFRCDMQLGGSDQWGNIVTGVELIRKVSGNESFGLTTPLLTTSSGAKMGKSVSGAIWLNEEQLSSYDYYQFWRNTEDNDVSKFARLYCEFSDQELIEFDHMVKHNINEAKKTLAYVATKLCHGESKADKAQETAIRVFEKGEVGDDLPVITIDKERIKVGIPCYELFFESGLASSKGDSRRLIRGNGAKINDKQVQDENLIVDESFFDSGVIKLSSGKKKHVLVKV